MRRRLKIAREQDRVQLLGFEAVMDKLEHHPKMRGIERTILGEIHAQHPQHPQSAESR